MRVSLPCRPGPMSPQENLLGCVAGFLLLAHPADRQPEHQILEMPYQFVECDPISLLKPLEEPPYLCHPVNSFRGASIH